MWEPYECPVCEASKPANWSLCVSCLDEHGEDRDKWPEWVVFLVSDNERLRYQDRRALDLEFSMPPDVLEEYTQFRTPEQLRTRPGAEMCWSESSARMLIPRDPYENDAANRAYRRANGVIEEGV